MRLRKGSAPPRPNLTGGGQSLIQSAAPELHEVLPAPTPERTHLVVRLGAVRIAEPLLVAGPAWALAKRSPAPGGVRSRLSLPRSRSLAPLMLLQVLRFEFQPAESPGPEALNLKRAIVG